MYCPVCGKKIRILEDGNCEHIRFIYDHNTDMCWWGRSGFLYIASSLLGFAGDVIQYSRDHDTNPAIELLNRMNSDSLLCYAMSSKNDFKVRPRLNDSSTRFVAIDFMWHKSESTLSYQLEHFIERMLKERQNTAESDRYLTLQELVGYIYKGWATVSENDSPQQNADLIIMGLKEGCKYEKEIFSMLNLTTECKNESTIEDYLSDFETDEW